MNKKEFLAMNLPHELKMHYDDGGEYSIDILEGVDRGIPMIGGSNADGYLPICHPLSDLTKPISQANYNNGEPFIPALELIKLEEKYNKWVDIAPTIPYDVKIINKPFGQVLKVSKLDKWVIVLSLNEIERAKHYVVTQLIKWHFNLMSEDEKFIDVSTLPENPYK